MSVNGRNKRMRLLSLASFLAILLNFFLFNLCMVASAEIQKDAGIIPESSATIFFKNSYSRLPNTLFLGERYTIYIPVENENNDKKNYSLNLIYNYKYFYCDEPYKIISMNAGEKRIVKFFIVPHKSHIGELQITAKLYQGSRELESVSNSVFSIQKKYSSLKDIVKLILFDMKIDDDSVKP